MDLWSKSGRFESYSRLIIFFMQKKSLSNRVEKSRTPIRIGFQKYKLFFKILVCLQEAFWLVVYTITLFTLICICSSIVFYIRMEGWHSPTIFQDWSVMIQYQSLEVQFYTLILSNLMLGFIATLAVFGEPPSRKTRFRIVLRIFRGGSSSLVEK